MYSSSLSNTKKSTAVDESLSETSTRCSAPENTNQLQDEINRMRNLHQIMHQFGSLALPPHPPLTSVSQIVHDK